MGPKRKRIQIVILILLFFIYFFIAARPVPREKVLSVLWISSVETQEDSIHSGTDGRQLLPFALGDRFGYVDSSGKFAINNHRKNEIYLNEKMWTEYDAIPSNIEIKNLSGHTVINIENPGGYPILLDNRIFILGNEQNSLSEIDANGNIKWTYDYGAIITCIDAAAGLVLTGSIDGIIEILDSQGRRIYYFEPGGSRISAIFGSAISRDGSRIGIICGLDPQRFLLLERYGNTGSEYRIVYHEFLDSGFRREVLVSFIDDDRRIIYERLGGIGCYNIRSRRGINIPLEGEISAVDYSGEQGLLFLITSDLSEYKQLVGIRFPQDRRFQYSGSANAKDAIFLQAPFKSDDVFLGRDGSLLIAGGGTTLISFNLEDN